jgi:hypothetical protein
VVRVILIHTRAGVARRPEVVVQLLDEVFAVDAIRTDRRGRVVAATVAVAAEIQVNTHGERDRIS